MILLAEGGAWEITQPGGFLVLSLPPELGEPEVLATLVDVRKHAVADDEIERSVLVGKRRVGLVDHELRVGKMLTAQAMAWGIRIGSV